MCGIWAVFGIETDIHSHCGAAFTKIGHRGPDAWRIEYDRRLKVSYCTTFIFFSFHIAVLILDMLYSKTGSNILYL